MTLLVSVSVHPELLPLVENQSLDRQFEHEYVRIICSGSHQSVSS